MRKEKLEKPLSGEEIFNKNGNKIDGNYRNVENDVIVQDLYDEDRNKYDGN